MVFGARQRREVEKPDDVDRQFLLDDLDVLADRFRRVGGEAENIAGIGDDADVLPGQQHVAVFGDLVLLLLRRREIARIDVLEPDENLPDAGAGGLLDEIRNLVTERVDLDGDAEIHVLAQPQLDDAVEDRLPVLVAREIVVRDQEAADAVPVILPDERLDAVGRAPARFASLHVDDGAERALERAAAAGVEARMLIERPPGEVRRQIGRHRLFERGQVVHVVIDRLQCSVGGIEQHAVEAAVLGLAGEQAAAHVERFLQVGLDAGQHGEHAGNVEPADRDRKPGRPQRPRDVERARILVRLHADETHEAEPPVPLELPDDVLDAHARVVFVDGGNLDVGHTKKI